MYDVLYLFDKDAWQPHVKNKQTLMSLSIYILS